MKQLLTPFLCAAALAMLAPMSAAAGSIERACRQSERGASNPGICSCIQKVADRSLSRSERKTVSKWFQDPHQAQVVRQSSRSRDEQLWKRYKAFGETAARQCG